MILSTFDRLILLNTLPKEGDITTLRIIRKLREDLSFSEEEHKALAFKQEGGKMMWQSEADKLKEVEVGDKAKEIIRNRLKELNEQKKLTEEHLPLYEKFVEAYENGS